MKDIKKGVRDVANFMAIAARTAPKARGRDNLVIKIFKKNELKELADNMIETGKKTSRPQTFKRDADNIEKADCLLLLATRYSTLELDCGFCGKNTCLKAKESHITCAYNSGDLGIAVGSAVAKASDFHIDNRIMYTVGYTVKKLNLLGKDIAMALGIPLSATGKNIFFDRN
ncbi:MAG: ferredoxin domain-containing protein [Elusimicrobiota bacterium]